MTGARRLAWKLGTAVAVLAVGLWLAAWRGGRGTHSPAPGGPLATSGTGGSPAHAERAHSVPAVPLRDDASGVDLAPGTAAEPFDPRAPSTEPVSEADVRPPAPPEALLPAPPEPRAPDRDTGLVFRDPVSGETTTETKQLHPSDPPAASSGPIPPAAAVDVRPPPNPAIFLPAPPRTGPDRDTGLVFRNEPGATDKR